MSFQILSAWAKSALAKETFRVPLKRYVVCLSERASFPNRKRSHDAAIVARMSEATSGADPDAVPHIASLMRATSNAVPRKAVAKRYVSDLAEISVAVISVTGPSRMGLATSKKCATAPEALWRSIAALSVKRS